MSAENWSGPEKSCVTEVLALAGGNNGAPFSAYSFVVGQKSMASGGSQPAGVGFDCFNKIKVARIRPRPPTSFLCLSKETEAKKGTPKSLSAENAGRFPPQQSQSLRLRHSLHSTLRLFAALTSAAPAAAHGGEVQMLKSKADNLFRDCPLCCFSYLKWTYFGQCSNFIPEICSTIRTTWKL